MKTAIAVLMAIMFVAVPVLAEDGHPGSSSALEAAEEEYGGFCPATKIRGKYYDCMQCHQMQIVDGKPAFGLQRVDPYLKYKKDLPFGVEIRRAGDELYLFHEFTAIDDDKLEQIVEFVKEYPEFKTVHMDIFSPGGGMMNALRCISIMENSRSFINWKTSVSAFAASAGFMVFMAGDCVADGKPASREVSPRSLLMWHEVKSFSWLSIDSPSSLRDDAKTYTMFQNNVHVWLAARSKVTVEELHQMVERKDFWARGVDCVKKYGFGDRLSVEPVEADWPEVVE